MIATIFNFPNRTTLRSIEINENQFRKMIRNCNASFLKSFSQEFFFIKKWINKYFAAIKLKDIRRLIKMRTSLNYSENIGHNKGYLMMSSPQLDELLQKNQQLIIEGDPDDNFMYSTQEETYQMQISHTRNTMLIIDPDTGVIQQELKDYITLEKCLPQYQNVYEDLVTERTVFQDDYFKMEFEQLVKKYFFTTQMITAKHKISQKQIQKFLRCTNCKKFKQGYWLCFSKSLLVSLMRNLMIYLNQQRKIREAFRIEDIAQHYQGSVIKQEILEAMATMFHFTREDQSFRISNQSIIRFILIDLAISKQLYMANQFNQILKQLLAANLPTGEQIPPVQKIQQVGEYFLFLKKKNQMLHYDPLFLQSSLKERMKFMESHKKRFSFSEIKGVFFGFAQGEQLKELVHKYFRNYGQEYQIKIIVGNN